MAKTSKSDEAAFQESEAITASDKVGLSAVAVSPMTLSASVYRDKLAELAHAVLRGPTHGTATAYSLAELAVQFLKTA